MIGREERQGQEDRQRQVPAPPQVAALREDGGEGQGHREGDRAARGRRQAVGAVAAPARAEGRHPQRRRGRPARRGGRRARARSASVRSTSRSPGRTASPSSAPTAPARPRCCGRCSARSTLASGQRWLGPGREVGLLDQRRLRYGGDAPLLPSFMAATGLDRSEARSLLAKFGLGADHVDRAGATCRRASAPGPCSPSSWPQGVNCLVLDEPTNHLDLEAIEQLESALDALRRHAPARDPRPRVPRRRARHDDDRPRRAQRWCHARLAVARAARSPSRPR